MIHTGGAIRSRTALPGPTTNVLSCPNRVVVELTVQRVMEAKELLHDRERFTQWSTQCS